MTAVVVAMLLTLIRPKDVRLFPLWVLPVVETVLLAVLIVRDPGRIDKRSSFLRGVSITVTALLVLDALAATVRLIVALIHGGSMTNSPTKLLAAGAVVWLSNLLAFALLYWELDAGGAANRAHRMPQYLDLAFTQQLSPEIARPNWRPGFGDYLYLGLTTSTAFSPTDVMPLAKWAKLAMGAQSMIALAVVGLVVARAVNVFT
ncbi:hypothetical protein [Kribbella sp. NPDC004875]|uniref:hypothetical protein n=1 Tax=Kribbella sp. NPDC004875 TaxID=3364107 RepID=UPI003697F739